VIRSYLYVPGDRPDRFDKARASGAGAVILDLEDAVAPDAKDAAREAVASWLRAHPDVDAVVRVNGGSPLAADVRAVVDAGARSLSLPKASPEALEALDAMLGDASVSVIALVETAAGVLDARAIASAPRVTRLAIGEADLGAELAIADPAAFAPMRAQVALASAAAGLEPPVGPVSTDLKDLDGLRASTLALKDAGFGARAAIHPAQVSVIEQAFTPTADEIARAGALIESFEAAGRGAGTDADGRMIDEAIVRAARRILS
jgi:citrate lyase subunit beta / citryl-CoA lyase